MTDLGPWLLVAYLLEQTLWMYVDVHTFNYGFSNKNVKMAKSQSSALHPPSLEPISRCKINKFFQLAVDAAALTMAPATLRHLQVFSYLADHASLWLLFYALSTTFFSDNWACLQKCKALFIQSSFFPMLTQGMVSSLPLCCSSPMVQPKAWCNDLPAGVLAVPRIHPNLWVTFTCRNLDCYSVYFLLWLPASEYRGKLGYLRGVFSEYRSIQVQRASVH